MTHATEPTTEDLPIRRGVAYAVASMAFALYAGAAALFVAMVADWRASHPETVFREWTGQLWFALLPVLAAAVVLHARSKALTRGDAAAGPERDWYRDDDD